MIASTSLPSPLLSFLSCFLLAYTPSSLLPVIAFIGLSSRCAHHHGGRSLSLSPSTLSSPQRFSLRTNSFFSLFLPSSSQITLQEWASTPTKSPNLSPTLSLLDGVITWEPCTFSFLLFSPPRSPPRPSPSLARPSLDLSSDLDHTVYHSLRPLFRFSAAIQPASSSNPSGKVVDSSLLPSLSKTGRSSRVRTRSK